MILFLLSFILVFISSYLLASNFCGKKYFFGIIYTMLIAFAQVVGTLEFLSLFSAISKSGILIINTMVLVFAVWFWNKNGRKLYKPKFKEFFIKVFKAFKKDKMLVVMAIGFLFFICVSLFLCFIMPVIAYDSLAYHFNRAVFWASQGNLNHFDIADARNIYMSINSEILYTWFLTFVPRSLFIGFFQFAGYVLAACSLMSFLEILGFCMRKRLWTLFLFSSISGVLVEASGMETDVIVGGLLLASLTLFLASLKNSQKAASLFSVYFSSLAVSLAVGTKTSAFFTIPAMAIIFACLIFKYKKDEFWRYLGVFLGFSIINTFLFSSYNYILNFIEFGSFIGPASSVLYHKMEGGLKGYISGVIRHLVLLLDFTGFSYGAYLQKYVFSIQDKFLTFLHIPLDLNIITSNNNQLNLKLNDSYAGGGVVCSFIMLPCMFIALCRGVFLRRNFKNILFALLALSVFVSIFVMSAGIGFMCYSSRFVVTFLVFASPVLIISYIKSNKNLFKYIILFYVLSYFFVISTHIWQRPFLTIVDYLRSGSTINEIRNKILCRTKDGLQQKQHFCILRSYLYKMPKGTKIALFPSFHSFTSMIKLMENDGYKVDIFYLEKISEYNLKDYDVVITEGDPSYNTNIKYLKDMLDTYYVEKGQIKYKNPSTTACIVLHRKGEKRVLLTLDNYKDLTPSGVLCSVPYEFLRQKGFKHSLNIKVGYFDKDGFPEDDTEVDEINVFRR